MTSKPTLNLTFAPITIDHLLSVTEFMNEISAEPSVMITSQGQVFTVEAERAYLENKLKIIAGKKAVHLTAWDGDKLIGLCDVVQNSLLKRHCGTFGLLVRNGYRGQGVGYALARETIQAAQKEITGLEIILLDVFAPNKPARKLYKKLGFKKYGYLPDGLMRLDGTKADLVQMELRPSS